MRWMSSFPISVTFLTTHPSALRLPPSLTREGFRACRSFRARRGVCGNRSSTVGANCVRPLIAVLVLLPKRLGCTLLAFPCEGKGDRLRWMSSFPISVTFLTTHPSALRLPPSLTREGFHLRRFLCFLREICNNRPCGHGIGFASDAVRLHAVSLPQWGKVPSLRGG